MTDPTHSDFHSHYTVESCLLFRTMFSKSILAALSIFAVAYNGVAAKPIAFRPTAELSKFLMVVKRLVRGWN